MLSAKKCSNLAEREGFEPSVPVTQYARLAIWCLRPLGHLSAPAPMRGGNPNSYAPAALRATAEARATFNWKSPLIKDAAISQLGSHQ